MKKVIICLVILILVTVNLLCSDKIYYTEFVALGLNKPEVGIWYEFSINMNEQDNIVHFKVKREDVVIKDTVMLLINSNIYL